MEFQSGVTAEVIGVRLVLGSVVGASGEMARGAGLNGVATHLHIPEERFA
jgi:hypothetical protein